MKRDRLQLLGLCAFMAAILGLIGLVSLALSLRVHAAQPASLATVLVNVSGPGGSGHGSGVHIGNGFILTANHVVDDAEKIEIETSDGKKITPELLWTNKKYDVALLRVEDADMASRELRCSPAIEGEAVWSLASPYDASFITVHGRVAGVPRAIGGMTAPAIILDMSVGAGMSGGPLYDRRGRILGLIQATYTRVPIGMAIPSSTVCALMGRAH
jgi:serine protease Do